MNPRFYGMYTALVTPFDSHGKVNEEVLRQLLHLQVEAQVDGVLVLGSTGEAPTITHEERRFIVKIAREETQGRLPLLVGTGSYATAQTIAYTQEAQELGADGALVVTPYYNRPSQEGLFQHYQALTQAVDLPIILYNIQGRTGQNLQTETLLRIAQLRNIYGVKEVSGSQRQMIEVIEQLGKKNSNFSVFCGDDEATLPSIMLGGNGVISVASNLVPVAMRQLTHSALAGDVQEAQRLHSELMPLFRALSIDTNPIPIKAAMQLSGLEVGGYRLPLCATSPQNLEKLRQTLAEMSEHLNNSFILR